MKQLSAKKLVSQVIGLSENAAKQKIESAGWIARIRSRNDKSYRETQDVCKLRLNLELRDDKVVKAVIG